jgi:hypothetical protein
LLRRTAIAVWALIALMALAVVCTYWAAGLKIDYGTIPAAAPIIPMFVAVSLSYRIFRPDPKIVHSTELVAQIALILLLGALLAYGAVAATRFPYRDAELLAADRWLGIDWSAYLAFIDAHPWLATLNTVTYLTIPFQPVVVLAVLVVMDRFERLQDFAFALVISLLVTIAVFALAPAKGWIAQLSIAPEDFSNVTTFLDFVPDLRALHRGTLAAVPFGDLKGIISFPSYHAAAGALAVWATWPNRYVRWPQVVVNSLMVASAPIGGAHYFVDIAAGLAVAILSVMAASWLGRTIRRRHLSAMIGTAPAHSALAEARGLPG